MGRYNPDVKAQKFWEQSINKEETTRLTWYANRTNDGIQGKSRQYEVSRKKIENAPKIPRAEGLPKIVPRQYHKRKEDLLTTSLAQLTKLGSGGVVFDKELLVTMRPVPHRTRELLYDGFTKEGKGRLKYLNARSLCIPEDKYTFPQTSNWDYGWKLSDVIQKEDIKKPKYGRTKIVADTFYTRTGIPTLGLMGMS